MRLELPLAVILCLGLAACSGPGGTGNSASGSTLTEIDPNLPLEEQISRLPGVYLNNQGRLRIRGSTSDPLIVIDGMQTSTADLSSINPADVETIEVLKGPETAMYGVRGGAGVILITTKLADS